MSSLQDITPHLFKTGPTNQMVNGEPHDVEKGTPQTTESREMAYDSPTSFLGSSSSSGNTSKRTIFKRFPSISSSYQAPVYRHLPIISGILIPFSILLSIPSLTGRWYIRTDGNNVTLESRPNPFLLDLGMGFSMACGVLANICLIVRFAERNVLVMTWLCILFLTVHDLINISALTTFGVQHRFHDGFTYGQSFWFTLCSTIASITTNITLIIDFSRTKDFLNSGSGLTSKQRSLVIIIIVLLCYIALGSMIQGFMLKVSFIDALYFTVVSIETIGFGDIHPTSAGSRVFCCFYVTGGILNLALAVALIREVILEGVALEFQARVKAIRTRQRERRIRTRWRTAVKLRLRANNLSMWVVDGADENDKQDWQHHYRHHGWGWPKRAWNFVRIRLSRELADKPRRQRKHLNLRALTGAEMEDAALEAGAPLADLLPPGFQLGASLATSGDDLEGEDDEEHVTDRGGVPFMHSMTMQDEVSLEDTVAAEEKMAFIARLTVALLVFIVFWMAGSAIFMVTEKWRFGTAVYFCFIAFTTVGYGDFSPQTPAGRSIFVAWSLLGVVAMTILISILVEAYSNQFKSVIRTDILPDGVNTPDERTTRQIRFLESPGTVDARTFISSTSLSATFGNPSSATSSRTGHRDCWEPSMAPIPEDSSQKQSLEALHEIMRYAQTLRSLIAPVTWLKDANPIESSSISAELKALPISPLSDIQRSPGNICQIEKTMQEIMATAQSALQVLDSERAATSTSNQ